MERSRLIEIANRAFSWFNDPTSNPAVLNTVFSPELSVPYPHPGTTGGLAGLVALIQESHKAFPGFKNTIRFTVVDESEPRIVLFVNYTGKQTGYWPPIRLLLTEASFWASQDLETTLISWASFPSRYIQVTVANQLPVGRSQYRIDCGVHRSLSGWASIATTGCAPPSHGDEYQINSIYYVAYMQGAQE